MSYLAKTLFKTQEKQIFFQIDEFQNSSPEEHTTRTVKKKKSFLDKKKIPVGNEDLQKKNKEH